MADTGTRRSAAPDHIHVRLILLALLVALINGWAARHLGVDLRNLSLVNGVTAALGVLLGYLQEPEQKAFAARCRGVLLRFADTTVLACLSLLFLLVSSFVSSVTVLADGTPGNRDLYLSAEGQARDAGSERVLAGPDGVERFLRLTTPFGRQFYLEADGYLRHSFDLRPWQGETIRVARDLRPTPTVLLRIPFAAHMHLEGGRLLVAVDGGPETAVDTAADRGSVMVGRARSVPGPVTEEWRSELRATSGLTDAQTEAVFRRWKAPLRLADTPSLRPEATLDARFVTRSDKVVAERSWTVGADPFQDVLLKVRR